MKPALAGRRPDMLSFVGKRVVRITAAAFGPERKVRAPQGRMPGNARSARAEGKCHRKQTARKGNGEKVG